MHTSTQAVERAVVLFDLEADFSDCFDWNTKQVFVYVIAEYSTPEHSINQATLFDQIIRSGSEDKTIKASNAAEYPLQHITSRGLAENSNVTLKLKYHVMCHSGVTHTKEVPSATITFKMPPKRRR